MAPSSLREYSGRSASASSGWSRRSGGLSLQGATPPTGSKVRAVKLSDGKGILRPMRVSCNPRFVEIAKRQHLVWSGAQHDELRGCWLLRRVIARENLSAWSSPTAAVRPFRGSSASAPNPLAIGIPAETPWVLDLATRSSRGRHRAARKRRGITCLGYGRDAGNSVTDPAQMPAILCSSATAQRARLGGMRNWERRYGGGNFCGSGKEARNYGHLLLALTTLLSPRQEFIEKANHAIQN